MPPLPPDRSAGTRRPFSWGLVFGSVAAVVVVGLLAYPVAKYFLGGWLKAVLFDWLSTNLALDRFAAEAVSWLLMVALAILGYRTLVALVWHVPSKRAVIVHAAGACAAALAVYTLGANVCFDVNTGEHRRYYSLRPGGEYFFRSDSGHDPLTGEALLPYTREVAREMGYIDCSVYGRRRDSRAGTDSTKQGEDSVPPKRISLPSAEQFVPLNRLRVVTSGFRDEEGDRIAAGVSEGLFGRALEDLYPASAILKVSGEIYDEPSLLGGAGAAKGFARWLIEHHRGGILVQGGIESLSGNGADQFTARSAVVDSLVARLVEQLMVAQWRMR